MINWGEIIFFNYFSLGSLIPVIFNFSIAAYFFSIKKRMTASTHLGVGFALLTLFNFAYFISSTVYHPAAAYHRWITVGIIMLAETHFNLFWCYYPEPRAPRFTRFLMIAQYAVSFTVTGIFFYHTWRGDTVFHFDGHYWDFSADRLSMIIGVILQLYILLFIFLALWRIRVADKSQRMVIVALTLSNLVAVVAPSFANTLSREGLIDRQVFQVTWDMFTVAGYFIMTIIYINNSRDKTTLLAKIVGIALVTFLMLMQGLGYVFFKDKERSYDAVKIRDTALLMDGKVPQSDVMYIVELPPDSADLSCRYLRGGVDLNFSGFVEELRNSASYEKLCRIPEEGFKEAAQEVLLSSGKYFSGYREVLGKKIRETGDLNRRAFFGYLRQVAKKTGHAVRIIENTPDEMLASAVNDLAAGDPALGIFFSRIRASMNEKGFAPSDFRRELMKYISPVTSADTRTYRSDREGSSHMVSFRHYDEKTGTIYEAGFSYIQYREYFDSFAMMMILVMASVLIFIRFGFQVFLTGVLLTPIRQLLGGIKNLNEGKLDFFLPVKVEDEIGYLSRTFNSMVSRLKIAGKERELAEKAYRNAEERFRGLVEQSLVGIYIIYQGRFAYVNPKCAEIFGYTQDEMMDMEYPLEVFTETDRMQAEINLGKRERAEELGLINTYHGVRKDGREILVEIYGSRMEIDGKGAVIGTLMDITDRVRGEAEMMKMRSFLKNIIDSMPSVLISVDKDRKVMHWNSQAERMTSVDETAAMGKPMEEFLPLLRIMKDDVTEAIIQRTEKKLEKLEYRQDDEIRYSDILVYPLVANGVEGAVIRIDDVTARVRLEEMMVQTEKMMSVGGLAAGMAHEINNPLSGILMSAHNLKRRISPDLPANVDAAVTAGTSLDAIHRYMEARGLVKMIDAIEELGERSAKIVANMLSFSRRSEAHRASESIIDVVDKAVELARHDYDLKKKYDFRHVEIEKDYENDVPPVYCAETEIEQVVLNLLKNAAHAMSEKRYAGEKPLIYLRIWSEGDMVCLQVKDNGPGMEKKVFTHIFDPFFTTKKAGIGTGLGLSVSYHIIVNNHGGEMTASSEPGKGAAFIIKLPRA